MAQIILVVCGIVLFAILAYILNGIMVAMQCMTINHLEMMRTSHDNRVKLHNERMRGLVGDNHIEAKEI